MSARLLATLVTIAAIVSASSPVGGRLDAAVAPTVAAGPGRSTQEKPRHRQVLVVVIVETPFLLLPDVEREPLRMLEAGTVLKWIGEDTDWFHAEFQDFHYGRRVGYVQKRDAVAVDVDDQADAASRNDDTR